MGAPMAANMVAAGHRVIGYNRSRPAVDRLAAAGGEAATSIQEAVRKADFVITMLPDSPDVEEVVLGDDGVFAHAPAGARLLEMSTIRPDLARRIAQAGRDKGIGVLDAPVSGGEQGAVEGTLSVMVGGDAADLEASKDILGAVGSMVVHVGGPGAGQTVKAANQMIVAGNIALVAEAISFLEAHGVQTRPALDVIGGGLAGSTVLARKAESMICRDFKPGFRAELHHKDLGIAMSTARQAGVSLPVSALISQLVAAVVAQGKGRLDHTAILTLIDALAGRDPSV
jgi:2-hydroxy-3-oxopropionate reductase